MTLLFIRSQIHRDRFRSWPEAATGGMVLKKLLLEISATGGVLWKGVFLEILENSQENACEKTSFLIKLQALNKRLWHGCVPVSFPKFLRTPFSIEHLRWLLLSGLRLP